MDEVQNSGRYPVPKPGTGLKTIASAALLVGTLDLISALLLTLLRGGTFLKLSQYIASGVFGDDAFQGGTPMAVAGVFFHYIIATGWTVLFFTLYPAMKSYLKHPLFIAVAYGIFIWVVMNLVVLPLSNIPESPFNFGRALIAMLVLIVAIGLPLAFIGRRELTERKNPDN